MSRRRRIQTMLEFVTGIIALFLGNLVSLALFSSFGKIPNYPGAEWFSYGLIATISYIIIFLTFASPLNMLKRSKPAEIISTTRNCAFTYPLFALLLLLSKNAIIESRYMFIGGFIFYLAFSLALRYILKKVMLKKISSSKHATQTGIITTTDRAEEFISRLQMDWSKNIKAVALLDTVLVNDNYCKRNRSIGGAISTLTTQQVVNDVCGIPVVANKENLIGWIRTASLDEVYINLPYSDSFPMHEIIEELEDMGITVNVNIPSLEKLVEDSKFDNINCIVKTGYPMAVFTPAVQNEKALVVKRIFDVIGSLIGCIISTPIILITAIPLLKESPGPLFFKQQRIGKNGRIFNIYKLRSMYVDAEERKKALMEQNKMEGFMFKMDNDPRITKVGRFIRKYSIDELPQFFNVLKGDMSLVGTRPPTIDEFEKYESHHKRRLSLKPGITGIWQVSGRSNIVDFEEVVKMDCEYIDKWSIWLDIKILIKTVGVVLTHKGAE